MIKVVSPENNEEVTEPPKKKGKKKENYGQGHFQVLLIKMYEMFF